MKTIPLKVLTFIFFFLLIGNMEMHGQKKKLKRPNSKVGITTVDSFVSRSFNVYDKVYLYEGYKEAGKSLDDDDLDVLESAIEDVSVLTADTPDLISSLDGKSVLKQSKATLQINRAKKALKYSLVNAKALLVGKEDKEIDKEEEK